MKMVGEQHQPPSPAYDEQNTEQPDLDSCLYIDEQTDQSAYSSESCDQSDSSGEEHSDDDRSSKRSPIRNLEEELHSDSGSSLSKLQLIVNNLLEKNAASNVKVKSCQSPPDVTLVGTRTVPRLPTSTCKRSKQRTAVKPVPTMHHNSSIIPGMPAMPTMPMPGMYPMMPMGLPPVMPGYPPFISPFGFPPFMMPPVSMGMMPSMPPTTMPPTTMPHMVPPTTTEVTPPKVNMHDDDNMPLDLSLSSKKRRLNVNILDTPPATQSAVSNSAIATHQGLLQIHIPQSIKPSPVNPSHLHISSPKPTVLLRNGTSAFRPILSPVVKVETPVKAEKFSPISSPDGASLRLKEMSVYEHNVLQMEFLEAAKKPKTGAAIRRLQQAYRKQVDNVEIRRHKVMEDRGGRADHQVGFDNERLLLARQFSSQLIEEKKHLGLIESDDGDVGSMPSSIPHLGMAPIIYPRHMPFQMPFPVGIQGITPLDESPQKQKSPCHKDTESPNSSYESNSAGEHNMSPTDHGDENHRGQKRKFLSPIAVSALSEWYENHFDHPYPDESTIEQLAVAGHITPSQVKKWMANKRVRSCNTLAFNGSIHPKKLQKLMQLKESKVAFNEMETAAPIASVINSPTSEKKSKRLLNPKAVDYMNNWYFEHLNYPYPTEEEKARIAQDTDLAVPQVTCWFANKRNRSNNTRKISTKTMWQKLNRKMQFLDAMNMNSDGVPISMVPPTHMSIPVTSSGAL